MLLVTLLGWLEREHGDVIAFLREENRTLKAQLGSQRLRLNEDQRRRLAVLAYAGAATRARHAARGCNARHARHSSPMASRSDCVEMHLRAAGLADLEYR